MKPIRILPLLSLLLLLAPSCGNASSMLRISCEGNSSGADVLINGSLKGDCPIDIQVLPGTIKLRVQKNVRQGREAYFEKEIIIGDGVVKKIEISLGQYALPSFSAVQSSANSGNASAMTGLAWRYRKGMVVPQNDNQSLLWYQKAATTYKKAADERADTDAMIALGDLYYEGNGVDQSDQQGDFWYLKAANGGNGKAMLSIGDRVSAGKGNDKSDEQAKSWYQRAIETLTKKAETGNGEAMIAIGAFYDYGGGKQNANNEQEAVSWYRKAAESGNLTGMLLYAFALEYARGDVTKDTKQALTWMKKAAAGGEDQAIDYLRNQR